MMTYVIRRLLLLPLTLLGIILINFLIINLAPGEPTTVTDISPEGSATRQEKGSGALGFDDRYLQFRERYGLTLPILFNTWPWISRNEVSENLWSLVHRRNSPTDDEMSLKDYDRLRISLGDKARFIMPHLLSILEEPTTPPAIRKMASRFFARGATQQAYLGASISAEERKSNVKIAADNILTRSLVLQEGDTEEQVRQKVSTMRRWMNENEVSYEFTPSTQQKIAIFFFETRFFRYMSRVLTLDFGTLRNDDTKSVIDEVVKRFKYSLTLALVPMILTFFLCLVFGSLMAYQHGRPVDLGLNLLFLILYAVPIFVVAPFLIEKVALGGHFPFTHAPIPLSGFTSPEPIYKMKTSAQRLLDVLQHIVLPIVAIMYGGLAVQSRIARTAVLEVRHQDYVRTARAKGVPTSRILFKHVGPNAAITLVTSIAGSLGVVLGGSLIVETLFKINGFGKFFYDAVVNWDYNVIMFSAFAGSALTLLGYLTADIAYMILDPRVTLE